ncbi:hypothetical protein GOBAR_DD09184 [Gossypium barbadense]|nr:hypothetical protein GOBAR_DD09184 [Gossypium barbadense]
MCKIVSTWKASVPASDVLMKEQRGFEFKSYIQHLRLHEWNVSDMPNFLITQSTYNYQSFEKTANEAFAKRFGADETTSTTALSPVYLENINYHHSGAPKTWYGVPGHVASQFDKVARDYVYDPNILSHIGKAGASALLAEKTTMFPPNILLQHNVPVHKAVQMAGEYVITFPRAYHAGFSFNCGEAVNFAFGDWFPWGAVAGLVNVHSCRTVILPYEELLCKEAIILSKSSNYGITETASESCVRSSFVTHIESLNIVL